MSTVNIVSGYSFVIREILHDINLISHMLINISRNTNDTNREILLSLSNNLSDSSSLIKQQYSLLFCLPPPSESIQRNSEDINSLIILQNNLANKLSRLSKNAPTKKLSIEYQDLSHQLINNSYLLLIMK
ncbi:MAG: hypothetical protein PHE51_03790 [Eubacteriales bacterium]|nr:hypothetical protein [Eubacteriales bacterium]